MPSTPPDGEPAPSDGALPEPAQAAAGARGFGIYLHVPFCTTRCGYCDFNTYTMRELGGTAGAGGYAETAIAEVRLARHVLTGVDLPARSVFVGGGTPTLLPPEDLGRLLCAVEAEFGLDPGAEVTSEANPESVDADGLERLRTAGYTRISFGMQSARSHVLALLDRQHAPDRVRDAVRWARRAGFEQVSLDLIYGTPGESEHDWQASLEEALGLAPDHLSAYALVVEGGTRLARRVRRGEMPAPDDEVLADRYVQADETLCRAGYGWYEVSNWARGPDAVCRHNLGYWRGADWWGVGAGAHSHVGGVRWWNVRHPAAYAARLACQESPAEAREVLDDEQRRVECVLLGVRLAEGVSFDELTYGGRRAAATAVQDGLLDPAAAGRSRAVLTLRGRLLADLVARELVDDRQ